MGNMTPEDEFAEFDVTEDEFDTMMAQGTPVEVIVPGEPAGTLPASLVALGVRVSTSAALTTGAASCVVSRVGGVATVRQDSRGMATLV